VVVICLEKHRDKLNLSLTEERWDVVYGRLWLLKSYKGEADGLRAGTKSA